VAVTAEVRRVNPGTWSVTARPVSRAVAGQPRPAAAPEPAAAGRVPWPRRVTVQAGPNTTVHTASTLRSKVPGVIRHAYACLVVLGVLTGLAIEGVLLAAGHYPVLRPELLSVAAVALAAYTLVRQGILSFRDEPRHWRHGRAVTASLAAAALIAGVVVLVVA
jgi:hypothetical protein